MIIDFHTHRIRQSPTIIEVVSLHHDQADRPFRYHTRGFHPWWTDQNLTQEQLELLEKSFTQNDDCLGIGECGLDNLKGSNIELQEEIFVQQLLLANKLNAPIIVHCVRAFDRLLRLRKKYGQTQWVVHGFVRNKILAYQALDAGLYLSLAPHRTMALPFIETLQAIPLDRLFIETDSDPSLDIIERYRIFAELKSLSLHDLESQILTNFNLFFSTKWKHQNG
jgi:TatD DNase family protein